MTTDLDHVFHIHAGESRMGNGCTGEAPNQRMGRRRRNAIPPGEQVPDNGRNKSGQHYLQGDHFFVHCFGNGIGYIMVLKDEVSDMLNNAAQRTAWKGVSTFVETTVAMELAAS